LSFLSRMKYVSLPDPVTPRQQSPSLSVQKINKLEGKKQCVVSPNRIRHNLFERLLNKQVNFSLLNWLPISSSAEASIHWTINNLTSLFRIPNRREYLESNFITNQHNLDFIHFLSLFFSLLHTVQPVLLFLNLLCAGRFYRAVLFHEINLMKLGGSIGNVPQKLKKICFKKLIFSDCYNNF
jgi:hypothetical protein